MRTIILASLAIGTFLLSACVAPSSSEIAPANTAAPDAANPTSDAAGAAAGLLPTEAPPAGAEAEFSTDFNRHTVPYGEVFPGGPPKDGIPAIDAPQFVTVAEADEWLQPQEPVVLVQVGEDARAYPLQILTWHEIVNDMVSDLPLTITFCPLCNTAIAFERSLDGRVLDFGTTGRLRFSNLIMYDRQTESWWQQASGDAIAGDLAGRQLTFFPATIVAWDEFKDTHPNGMVLSRATGFSRSYGKNPYVGYDDVNQSPFLFRGPQTPGALPPMARVLTVDLDGEAVAYPYDALAQVGVVNDTVAGQPVAVFWQSGVASALDRGSIAAGRDVGAAAAFSAELNDRRLTFRSEQGRVTDNETGSAWDLLGRAVAGELTGQQLAPVVSVNHFWFSWAAFKPETRIYQP